MPVAGSVWLKERERKGYRIGRGGSVVCQDECGCGSTRLITLLSTALPPGDSATLEEIKEPSGPLF